MKVLDVQPRFEGLYKVELTETEVRVLATVGGFSGNVATLLEESYGKLMDKTAYPSLPSRVEVESVLSRLYFTFKDTILEHKC